MDKRFDFCFEKEGSERLVFRFDPERSRLHRFGDTHPTDWSGVYKVYYAWGIYYENGGEPERIEGTTYDECSALDHLPDVIEEMAQYNRDSNRILYPMGCGMAWQVTTHRDTNNKECFFTLNTWHDSPVTELGCFSKCVRLRLSKQKALDFARYIKWVNEYMFRHSEPI